jgi:hypothetical protein
VENFSKKAIESAVREGKIIEENDNWTNDDKKETRVNGSPALRGNHYLFIIII